MADDRLKISFRGRNEYPLLAWLPSELRAFWFSLNNVLDRLSNETRASCDKNNGHVCVLVVVRVERGLSPLSAVECGDKVASALTA